MILRYMLTAHRAKSDYYVDPAIAEAIRSAKHFFASWTLSKRQSTLCCESPRQPVNRTLVQGIHCEVAGIFIRRWDHKRFRELAAVLLMRWHSLRRPLRPR